MHKDNLHDFLSDIEPIKPIKSIKRKAAVCVKMTDEQIKKADENTKENKEELMKKEVRAPGCCVYKNCKECKKVCRFNVRFKKKKKIKRKAVK